MSIAIRQAHDGVVISRAAIGALPALFADASAFHAETVTGASWMGAVNYRRNFFLFNYESVSEILK